MHNRCKYQGLYPPVKRAKEGFDPGAKLHIAIFYKYISYRLWILRNIILCQVNWTPSQVNYKLPNIALTNSGISLRNIFDVHNYRYFISRILQFQFYQTMCNKSGHTGELNNCDFYNSSKAGSVLRLRIRNNLFLTVY